MATYSVDRIEGGYAVLVDESGADRSVPLTDLPDGVKEGSVLRQEHGVYVIDEAKEQLCRGRILSLQEKLRRKNQT